MFQSRFSCAIFSPEGGKGSVLLLHVLLPVSSLQLHTGVQQERTLHLEDQIIPNSSLYPWHPQEDGHESVRYESRILRVSTSVSWKEHECHLVGR